MKQTKIKRRSLAKRRCYDVTRRATQLLERLFEHVSNPVDGWPQIVVSVTYKHKKGVLAQLALNRWVGGSVYFYKNP